MARGTRRSVVALMTVGGAFAFGLLAGCGAAPESVGESNEALPKCNPRIASCSPEGDPTSTTRSPPPRPPPPVCRPHGEHPYTPPTPLAQGIFCSAAADSFLNHRAFEATNPFEAALAAANCTNDVQALAGGPAIPPGGLGWSYATCPDSCAVRALIHQYHPVNPFGALTSDERVSGCSGVPAAGTVFAVWDPRCPSACELLTY